MGVHTEYIGIFNDSFPPVIDGVTLTVENYVKWLGMGGEQTCVVTPWNPVTRESSCKVMRYFSLPLVGRSPYRYGYPKADPFIWRRLSGTPFKIVHSHCPFSSGRLAVYAARKQGVPLVGTFHSKYRSDLEAGMARTPWLVPIIMRKILDFYNACDEVWIPQAAVEQTVREYGFKGRLTVVENGNDLASSVSAAELADVRREARRRLGIGDSAISLLFVGQHIEAKGIYIIAEALKLLADADVDFVMNYVGTGNAAEELQHYIDSHNLSDRVHLNGNIEDRGRLRDFYAAADLFLFPSFYDNAPLVVREAAALGTPSILLVGSTAAEPVCDGVNGYLTQRSPSDYSAAIKRLAQDRNELHRVGLKARETLTRTWEDVVSEVITRYGEIIEKYNKKKH